MSYSLIRRNPVNAQELAQVENFVLTQSLDWSKFVTLAVKVAQDEMLDAQKNAC